MENNKLTKKDIEEILKYIKSGPFKARELTKEETHKNSPELKDAAWKAGEELMKALTEKFYNFPPTKKYMLGTQYYLYYHGLLAETFRTFQNTFRLAEEGYYRSALADLRDLLELVMKIKFFYENTEDFYKWINHPNSSFYTTKDMRDSGFFSEELNNRIEDFSTTLSKNRHSLRFTLDSLGPVITNVSYYRKDMFEKWCKHMIDLKELTIEIINFDSNPYNVNIELNSPPKT